VFGVLRAVVVVATAGELGAADLVVAAEAGSQPAQLCSYAWELGIPVPLRWCDVGGQLAAVLLACDHYVF
jgi:hypothetical protein